ncbi:Clp protease N-terminal domain-containing protein [Jatrophihabitans sp. YIM 134969]
MLERFTRDARAVVIAARAEAVGRGHRWIGTEHLVVGLLEAGGPGVAALRATGVTVERIRAGIADHVPGTGLDAEALATLGIDLDAVRRAAEDQFGVGALEAAPDGRGRIRMTRRAKKVLELAVRESRRRRESSITSTHLLLGLLREGGGLGVRVLAEQGVDVAALRTALQEQGRDGRAA